MRYILLFLFSVLSLYAKAQQGKTIEVFPLGSFSLDSDTRWAAAAFDKNIPEGVKVVGLGEVLHGGKEVTEVKAKVVQYLVSKRGYRIFLFEYPNAALSLLNYYLQNSNMNSADTLEMITRNAMAGSLYDRSLIDLMAWFKKFNRSHPDDMVAVRGFDVSGASGSFSNYFMNNFAFLLDSTTRRHIDRNWNKMAADTITRLLLDWFYDVKDSVAIKGSKHYPEFLYNVKNAEFSLQYSDLKTTAFYRASFFRDSLMARNIEECSSAKSIVWSHNLHINPWANYGAGKILKTDLKEGYYTILSDFSQEAECLVKTEGGPAKKTFRSNPYAFAYRLSKKQKVQEGIVFYESASGTGIRRLVNTIGNEGSVQLIGPEKVFDALIILKEINPSAL